MKILLIHADHFEYEVKKEAVEEPEELTEENKAGRMDEVLVAFCTVEKEDERDIAEIARKSSDSIEEVAGWVKVKNIMLYPYAHLSPSLARREAGISVMKSIEKSLQEKGFNIKRSPFGWYKSFTLKCKGHPLSELSRSISIEEKKVEAKPEEESEFIILDEEGTEFPVDVKEIEKIEPLLRHPVLKQFVIADVVGKVGREPPPHTELMRKLELVDYEPASDIGHFRFYPKGALIKHLLESFATDLAVRELQCIRIETPCLYRMDQPDIAEQTSRYVERDYRFTVDGKDFILRFAGDFGLFKIMKGVTMSYKQLPIRVYELAPSYRLEKSGECVGLKRLRAFTMPDIHSFCRNLHEGMDEFKKILEAYTKLADSMEIDYAMAFRVIEDFYRENKDWFVELVKVAERPALIEVLKERKHYWIVKHEYQFVDSVGGNAQLCTVQLDIEDSERYGIFYVDADEKKKGCIIVHSSMGSIERWIYALLEHAAKMKEEGKPPMLPVWLSPTQVRIMPVSPDQLDYAKGVLEKIEEAGIRADLDDREVTLAKKVREGEMEWIPYLVTIGKREEEGGYLTVRIRGDGIRSFKLDEFIEEARRVIVGKPSIPLHIPRLLSMRPKFVG